MTDDRTPDPDLDPDLDPELDPATDAHLRALLAELGSGPDGDPMPPQIAARLDATLARLTAETARVSAETAPVHAETAPVSGDTAPVSGDTARVSGETASNVVPLRRRPARRAFAAAAAAVVLLGAGGVAVAQLGGVTGSSGGSSADSATSGSAGGSASAPESEPGAATSEEGARDQTLAGGLPAVRLATFDADATRLLRQAAADRSPIQVPNGRALAGAATTPPTPTPTDDGTATPAEPDATSGPDATGGGTDTGAAAVRRAGCLPPTTTDGALPSPITLDGQRAVLVVHPARDGRRLVQAWSCSGARVLASARVVAGG